MWSVVWLTEYGSLMVRFAVVVIEMNVLAYHGSAVLPYDERDRAEPGKIQGDGRKFLDRFKVISGHIYHHKH